MDSLPDDIDSIPKPQWYTKLWSRLVKWYKPNNKDAWRDASLPDKERWKEWHKAMDHNQAEGYVIPMR